MRRSLRSSIILLASVVAGLALLVAGAYHGAHPIASAAVTTGYVDFSFFRAAQGTTSPDLVIAPTAEKPESKLWYNDGFWWGSMFDRVAGTYQIYKLNGTTQQWTNTGTAIDSRPQARADTLWDGTHLYVASGGVVTTTAVLDGVLFRYSYSSATKSYTRDFGPTTIRPGGASSIVIDKDTTGTLWMTSVQNGKVMINHSTTSDSTWGAPFVLPVAGASGLIRDMASLVAYDGKIGVMWGNSTTSSYYFATHVDGAADTAWTVATVASQPGLVNNHINLRALANDPAGNVFAVVKTGFTTTTNPATDPQIELFVGKKQPNGALAWSVVPVSNLSTTQTRPIVEIDTDHRALYVFSSTTDGGAVYYKSASLDSLQFDTTTKGTLLIRDPNFPYIGNVTSTKQNVGAATGLVVLASYDNETKGYPGSPSTDYYLHGVVDVSAPVPTATATAAATATATAVPSPTPSGANDQFFVYVPAVDR